MRLIAIVAMVACVAGCTSVTEGNSNYAFELNRHRIAECERKNFPTHREKAECMNAADRKLMPALGADADLLRFRMAKRIEVAERIDKGQISVAKANSEILRVYAQVQSERNRRVAVRAQTVATIMQAQNQNAALKSIANSQARIANTLESQNGNVNGQRDPFIWAEKYSRESSW